MTSRRTREFRRLLRALPRHVRADALEAYRQFQADPTHRGLAFKLLDSRERIYSARVGRR